MNTGNIPVIECVGKSLAEAWELSVIKAWEMGTEIKTQYDKPSDPPSRDCTMIMVCNDPFAEPRLHRSFPGGFRDLEVYRQEVVNGIHDSWIKPEEGKWTYTYHERLFKYRPATRGVFHNEVIPLANGIIVDSLLKNGERTNPIVPINQIQFIIDSLAKTPYSRRSQAITYMPTYDQGTDDPPCLQRIWCRILIDDSGVMWLNMNTNWRSRDAYKAAFMNMYALTDLQRFIAEGVSKKMGKEVKIGRYVDISDSYHIYGSYFKDFEERFLKNYKERTFTDRVWDSDIANEEIKETREAIERREI